jgi:hypothetical protein
MMRAMERHEAGEAIVIPVILRACDWHGAPFGKLNASPPDGRPVTQFPDRDQALLEVAKAVRAAAARSDAKKRPPSPRAPSPPPTPGSVMQAPRPRSSNLRVTKEFNERDKDVFKVESFEFIAKYFENSLAELHDRNPDIETAFRRVDANRFSAVVYKNGTSVSRCTVFVGNLFRSGGIAYTSSETTESNSYNEYLTIEADDQSLFLKGMGAATMRADSSKLSQEGAAELYWSMLIAPLQYR